MFKKKNKQSNKINETNSKKMLNEEEISTLVNMNGEDEEDDFVTIGDDIVEDEKHFDGFESPEINEQNSSNVYDIDYGIDGTQDHILNPLGSVDENISLDSIKSDSEESIKSKKTSRNLFSKARHQNIDSENGKSKNKRFKSSNKKDDFAVLSDGTAESSFVIIENKTAGVSGKIKVALKTIALVILFITLSVGVYFCLQYKMIPEKIAGYNWYSHGISIISNDYQPNIDELQQGDVIICLNDKTEWIPFQFTYNRFEYKDRNGALIFVEDKGGDNHTIESVDIDYIVKIKRN